MAKSGIYKVKNREKYQGDAGNIVYRSSWEKRAFEWCDRNKDVVKFSSEEVIVPYWFAGDKKWHRYFVDLKIVMKDGTVRLIEIKPKAQTMKPKFPGRKTKRYLTEAIGFVKNQNKWEAAEKYARDRNWTWEIWTEDTLTAMNILPKRLKALPKLRGPKKK